MPLPDEQLARLAARGHAVEDLGPPPVGCLARYKVFAARPEDRSAVFLFEEPGRWTVMADNYGPPAFRWEVSTAREAIGLVIRLFARPPGSSVESCGPESEEPGHG